MNRKMLNTSVMLDGVRSLLDEGREVVIPVAGRSMLPFIRGGRDSVRLAAACGLKVGDIVLARIREGVYVLHRIRAIASQSLTLQGDGNVRAAETCTVQDVIGVATGIIGRGGRERDPRGAQQMRLWKRWIRLPSAFRRVALAIIGISCERSEDTL